MGNDSCSGQGMGGEKRNKYVSVIVYMTYKEQFNKKYGFKKDKAHSVSDIARITGYKKSGLDTIMEKGKAAFYNNPSSVRPHVKSATHWGYSRLYAAVNPKSKAHKVDKSHLKR